MNKKRRFAACALVASTTALLCVFPSPPAAAVENETFGLVPHPEEVDGSPRRTFGVPLEPGAVFEDAVRIYNRTDQQLDLIIYAADAEAGLDGTISVGFRGSSPKGVGAWVEMTRDTLRLPPRGEVLVQFRVDVRSADPAPDLGAIAVEASERGVAANLAERLHLVIRTTSPNSPTTSVRVRPLLLRSPWIIIALIGLLVALAIVWLGARRARRPRDSLVPSGGLAERAQEEEDEDTQAASKPVLRRLGETQPRTPARRRRPKPEEQSPDARPIVDEMLADLNEPEPERERSTRRTTRRKTSKPKPAAPRSGRKAQPKKAGRFIPLDDI